MRPAARARVGRPEGADAEGHMLRSLAARICLASRFVYARRRWGSEVRMSDSASERSVPSLAASLTRSRSWRYVARPDSETALCRMLALLRGGETQVALLGPPASGKTLLLHVLSERLGPGFPSAYLPNPALGPDQVRPWLETCG